METVLIDVFGIIAKMIHPADRDDDFANPMDDYAINSNVYAQIRRADLSTSELEFLRDKVGSSLDAQEVIDARSGTVKRT